MVFPVEFKLLCPAGCLPTKQNIRNTVSIANVELSLHWLQVEYGHFASLTLDPRTIACHQRLDFLNTRHRGVSLSRHRQRSMSSSIFNRLLRIARL